MNLIQVCTQKTEARMLKMSSMPSCETLLGGGTKGLADCDGGSECQGGQ